MQMFIESHGVEIWKAIEESPFIPNINVDGLDQPKSKDAYNGDDKKEVQYDKKDLKRVRNEFWMRNDLNTREIMQYPL